MKNTYHYYLFALLLACTTLWPVCASNEVIQHKETTFKDWQNQRQKEINKRSAFLSQQTVDGIALDKKTSSKVISFLFPIDSKPLLWDEFVARYQAGERFFDLCYIDLTDKNSDSYISDKHLVNGKRFECEDVNFTKSFFQGDLGYVFFKNCCLKQAIMNDIDARMAFFTACNLQGAELNRGNFSSGGIINSNCNQIQCIEGNMNNTMLISTTFEVSNLHSIRLMVYEECNQVSFKKACLINAIIQADNPNHIDFTQADCSGAIFYSTSLDKMIFDHTKLVKARIDRTFSGKELSFKYCDLTQADLRRQSTMGSYTNVDEAEVIEVQQNTFTGSWLEGADLSQFVNLDMKTLAHAYLRDAKLSKADSKRVLCLLKYYKNHRGIIDFSLQSAIVVAGIYFAYRHTE